MSVLWSPDARRVFIDTSAYYASINRKADHHAQVLAIFTELESQRGRIFTTNFIVAETHALVLNRLGRDVAARMLVGFDDSDSTIVRVETEDEFRAREIILSHDDKDYTLTDATSFAVMERFGITTAFTFDRHFLQYGFTVLGLDEP